MKGRKSTAGVSIRNPTVKNLHFLRRDILRDLIALSVQSPLSSVIGRGGHMSVGDFFWLCARTVGSARRNGAIKFVYAPMLAACIACAAVNEGHAALIEPAPRSGLPAITSFINVSQTAIDQPASTSFTTRFDCPQASLIMNILASPAYQAPLPRPTTASLPRVPRYTPAADPILGIASMYDPTDAGDRDSGDENTASGEKYDPNGWTAAIRTDLRAQFGGVRFGKNYRPAYALVESSDKRAIVRINDVGPLKRGRIIDLNKRAMHYFDPTLRAGLIDNMKVTPLADTQVALGPVENERPMSFASRFEQYRR
jgi:rare lipoprotein A